MRIIISYSQEEVEAVDAILRILRPLLPRVKVRRRDARPPQGRICLTTGKRLTNPA